MTKYEFASAVFRRLPLLAEPDDGSVIEGLIYEFQNAGWTVSETASYLLCTEECNPDLSEQVALDRMKQIMENVSKRLGLTK